MIAFRLTSRSRLEAAMSRTSRTSTEDGVQSTTSSAMVDSIPPLSTQVVMDAGSNWKALALGLFVVAGVTGK